MIINSQRTIYALEYQANNLINIPYAPRVNTTLNEKFNLLPNEPVGGDTKHNLKYLAIGVGGTPIVAGASAYSYTQHSPLDAALFDQIPFVMRLVTNDLTPIEQQRYRFRIPVTIAGVDYLQYYLRVIAATDITTDTYRITPSVSTTATLTVLTTNTSKHLNPVPKDSSYVLNEKSEFISKMVKLKFNLTPTELTDINNAIDIIHGPNSNISITEIGLCGGLDKTVATQLEAIQTQIYFHIGLNLDTRITYDPVIGYSRAIEFGGSEPLYV